jgi:hypothetical protein
MNFSSSELYVMYNYERVGQLYADLKLPQKPTNAPANWQAPPPTRVEVKLSSLDPNASFSEPGLYSMLKIQRHGVNPSSYMIQNTSSQLLPLVRDMTLRAPVFQQTALTETSTQWKILQVGPTDFVLGSLDQRSLDSMGNPYFFLSSTSRAPRLGYGPNDAPLVTTQTVTDPNSTSNPKGTMDILVDDTSVTTSGNAMIYGMTNVQSITDNGLMVWTIITYAEAQRKYQASLAGNNSNFVLYASVGVGMLLVIFVTAWYMKNRKRKHHGSNRRLR